MRVLAHAIKFLPSDWKAYFPWLLRMLLEKLINTGDSTIALFMNINNDCSLFIHIFFALLFAKFSGGKKYFSFIINMIPKNATPIPKTQSPNRKSKIMLCFGRLRIKSQDIYLINNIFL